MLPKQDFPDNKENRIRRGAKRKLQKYLRILVIRNCNCNCN